MSKGLRCAYCNRLLIKPLFFLTEGDTHSPICHKCAEFIIGPMQVKTLGGWTFELDGSTYITKVRR